MRLVSAVSCLMRNEAMHNHWLHWAVVVPDALSRFTLPPPKKEKEEALLRAVASTTITAQHLARADRILQRISLC